MADVRSIDMTLTLFPYQAETIENLRASMRRHKSVLLTLPTGSGKTAMATYMIRSAQAGITDGVKADTYYKAVNGGLVETEA